LPRAYEGLRGEELATLVQRVATLCETDVRTGAMVTVDETISSWPT
jgi:hypothetical protein